MLVAAGTAAPLPVDPGYRCGMYGPCPDPVANPVVPWLIAMAGFATVLAGGR